MVYVDDELYSMEKRPYLLEHLSEPLLLSKGDHEGDIHATDRGRDSALNSSDDERKEGDNETRPLVNDTDEESGKVKLKLKRVTPKKSPELRATPSSEECGFFFDDCRDRGDKGDASTSDVITEYVDHKIAIKMASKISSNVHKISKKLWKYEDGVESKTDKNEGEKNDEENDKKEKDGILIEEEEVEDQDAIDKREEEEDFVINEILKKMTPDTTSDDENFTYDNHSQKIAIKSSGTEPLNESKKKSIFWSSSLKTNGHHMRNGDDSSIGFRCVSNFSSLFWAITFSSMFVYGELEREKKEEHSRNRTFSLISHGFRSYYNPDITCLYSGSPLKLDYFGKSKHVHYLVSKILIPGSNLLRSNDLDQLVPGTKRHSGGTNLPRSILDLSKLLPGINFFDTR